MKIKNSLSLLSSKSYEGTHHAYIMNVHLYSFGICGVKGILKLEILIIHPDRKIVVCIELEMIFRPEAQLCHCEHLLTSHVLHK